MSQNACTINSEDLSFESKILNPAIAGKTQKGNWKLESRLFQLLGQYLLSKFFFFIYFNAVNTFSYNSIILKNTFSVITQLP